MIVVCDQRQNRDEYYRRIADSSQEPGTLESCCPNHTIGYKVDDSFSRIMNSLEVHWKIEKKLDIN